jgi:polyphosphate glucokinase
VKAQRSAQPERRRFASGPDLTPEQMVARVKELTADWSYDVLSIGVPAPVRRHQVVDEPPNLGRGWQGFDFEAAFGKPVRVLNDAAMQALGSYAGGHMLFLGLGTGLGSALIVGGHLQPLELGHLPYRRGCFEDYVGDAGRLRRGRGRWRRDVEDVVRRLIAALQPDEVVLGGGNVRHLAALPPGCRQGDNANAFLGGERMWDDGGELTVWPRRRPAP